MLPLQDLKVLDFSSLLPGPFATMYLADWGADVLRVEAPDRDDMSRTVPPFVKGTSTTHAYLNRSKRSVEIDLKTAEGRERIFKFVETYDIVVEQFRPGVMARLGLDYKTLKEINPRLIYCSISGFGQNGPLRDRAGHDVNYAALAGLAAVSGTQAEGPALHGSPVCDLSASFHALFGLMTAVYHREKTGEGQAIDVAISDSSLVLSGIWMQMQLAAGQGVSWESSLLNGGSFYGYYATLDKRYLSVGCLEPKFFHGFLEAIDALPLLRMNPLTDGPLIRQKIAERLATRNFSEWKTIFERLDVCVEAVLTTEEIAESAQFQARGMFVDVEDLEGGTQKQLASPLQFSGFSPRYLHIGFPKGAHNKEFG